MFTGIVEEMGHLIELQRSSEGLRLAIRCRKVLEGTAIGHSIGVSGVCLTVVERGDDSFKAEVMPETLKKTTLSKLGPGSSVNLERAMRLGERLGGHMVTGHIDGVGRVVERRPTGIAIVFRIGLSPELLRYVIPRGSVALDGISLTVAEKTRDSLVVSVIPHTAEVTTLGEKKVGDQVNVETDIIGRYVESLLHEKKELSLESLAKAGFLM